MNNVHPIMQSALLAVQPPPAVRVVHFHKIGANKASWTARLPNAAEDAIAKEAGRALFSRSVEAVYEEDNPDKGVIVVGDVRIVGSFEVEPLPVPA